MKQAPTLANHFTEKCVEKNRLVYYRCLANSDYWDSLWSTRLSLEIYEIAKRGDMGTFERPFIRYLPRDGRILEAGCGTVKLVVALRRLGYDIEGVDWAPKTIEKVKTLLPELPVRVGDVRDLDVGDDYYSAYISIGVVEHFSDGPEPILRACGRIPHQRPDTDRRGRTGAAAGHDLDLAALPRHGRGSTPGAGLHRG